jgi:hypothetical protein
VLTAHVRTAKELASAEQAVKGPALRVHGAHALVELLQVAAHVPRHKDFRHPPSALALQSKLQIQPRNPTPPGPACVFITAVPITKLFARGGGGNGGHVLRETTNRGLCELVCPSRTNERGGEGYCVKEGAGEEGERDRERAGEVRLYYSLGY